jgi:NADPH-dependent 2,4-dienoyl-CoA reductase/sulfur reductase-like enzyme
MADFNVKPLEAGLDFDHLRYWDAGRAAAVSLLRQAHRRHPRISRRHHGRRVVGPDVSSGGQRVRPVPRRLAVLDAISSKNVHYRIPKIGDYEGHRVAVVGGGDSALDAALMALGRHAAVDVIVREPVPIGKADTAARIADAGGAIRTNVEVKSAAFQGELIRLTLTDGTVLDCSAVVVQIGFLSAKDTFERLGVKLNEDGSISIDPYFETSRQGIFAVGDVHGDIKLITVAWAEGIQAAIHAFKEITSPYWLNERRLRDNKIALIGEKIAAAARTRKRNA